MSKSRIQVPSTGFLRSIYVSATDAYEFGTLVGEIFRAPIQNYYMRHNYLQNTLIPAYATDAGFKEFVDTLVSYNRKCYPRYFSELLGIAEGVELPVTQVLLMCFKPEITIYLKKQSMEEKPDEELADAVEDDEEKKLEGCADILLANESGDRMFGHNEDYAAAARDNAYLLHATTLFVGENGSQKFTAWTYPGMLPGMGFSFNAHGLCISIDAARPLNVTIGRARYFVTRDLLHATSVDNVLERLYVEDLASGFSLNLGCTKTQRLYQIEVVRGAIDVMPIDGETTQYFCHFNIFQRLKVPQILTTSSLRRIERSNKLVPVKSRNDIIRILSDTNDKEWPIYRNAIPPDPSATHCTALFNLVDRKMYIWMANAALHPNPVAVVDLP